MKKRRIIALLMVLITVFACLAGGRYYIFREKNEKILSLEIPPFADEITVYEGETSYENYFEVVYENGFSYRDIEFVSENEKVASVRYSVTDRNRYVCFKVEGKSAGETEIYFSANGGETVSEKIKVTVLKKKTDDSNSVIQTTESETTVETVATERAENVEQQHEAEQTEADTTHTDITESTSASDKSTTGKKTDENYGNTVYIAPTGKRYHYSKSCAGKNGKAVTKSEAIESGRTPCKKCAGG